MRRDHAPWSVCCLCVVALIGFLAVAQGPEADEDGQERKVKAEEVPAAALQMLRALAGGAAITEFAEEIEHGHTFYEGSWQGPTGQIDALVTEFGDLVEIEETVPAESVPNAVRARGTHAAGANTKLTFEKKTLVMYELHYRKDGKEHELILTPDARVHSDENAASTAKSGRGEDEDEDD